MNPVIKSYLVKISIITLSSLVVLFVFRFFADEKKFLIDAGGLSGFATIFGTLYGIITAFILFTVWSQFNNTSAYIDGEANALKQLYRFSLFLKDEEVAKKICQTIENYTKLVIIAGFKSVAAGERDPKSSEAFQQIFLTLSQIETTKNHQDQLILDHLLKQFKELSDIRTKRLAESLTRLPLPLWMFLLVSSTAVILTFALPVFINLSVAIFVMIVISALVSLLLLLIRDLDNPFVGYWNLGPEPFRRFIDFLEKE